jgi:hypothetical protein
MTRATYEQYKALHKKGPVPTYYNYADWRNPTRKEGRLGITCEEWIGWWTDTGLWEQRGIKTGQYYMSRIDKELPFSLDNIELKQRVKGKKRK